MHLDPICYVVLTEMSCWDVRRVVACGTRFFCCFENAHLLVVCMHACVHTILHQFNVKIALNISGLGALHTGRDAL